MEHFLDVLLWSISYLIILWSEDILCTSTLVNALRAFEKNVSLRYHSYYVYGSKISISYRTDNSFHIFLSHYRFLSISFVIDIKVSKLPFSTFLNIGGFLNFFFDSLGFWSTCFESILLGACSLCLLDYLTLLSLSNIPLVSPWSWNLFCLIWLLAI